MKSFQCTDHKKDIVYYCNDQHCEQRCLCAECEHEHDKTAVQNLLEGYNIKELVQTFQSFKYIINDLMTKMEQELSQHLQQIKQPQATAQNLEQFDKQLSEISNIQNTLKNKIKNRLQHIINALKGQDLDQSPNVTIFDARKKEHSKSVILSQAQIQQDMIKKTRQSKIFKMNIPQSNQQETQQIIQQPNLNVDRIEVARLQQLSTQDWAWKMTSSTVFCCIFSSLRDLKIIGFLQPCLFKSNTNNYQKKSAVINVGIYNKKNLTKQPIHLEKYTLRHSKLKIVNDCYELMFSKPIAIKEFTEYSIAIWPSKVLYSHYFSIAASINPFIAFQTQDFNDNPKIKRSEEFPQVISTFRAGLVPYLIIDPRQQ
ncbi:unnamed protein product [Paramecium primaurelia]|uniref:Uncharacterized protein n=1 Tax=Paramecium primaurelia TaxID=5886 RepID=A0A8S1P330_PARPR|nr:unnamed protein product [Paramecium primaurelia]